MKPDRGLLVDDVAASAYFAFIGGTIFGIVLASAIPQLIGVCFL